MKNKTAPLALTFALLVPAAKAQQSAPAYDFRAVAQPGAVIGGHVFTRYTHIGSVALSDEGEVVFVASWPDAGGGMLTGVFTSKRLVASEGDVIDGKTITNIAKDVPLSINRAGQVAFEATYRYNQEEPEQAGVFVEKHLAFTWMDTGDASVKLNDYGDVLVSRAPSAPALQTKRQPQDDWSEFTILRPPFAHAIPPFAVMCVNWRGQVLIPVDLTPRGFILLLATPSAANSNTR